MLRVLKQLYFTRPADRAGRESTTSISSSDDIFRRKNVSVKLVLKIRFRIGGELCFRCECQRTVTVRGSVSRKIARFYCVKVVSGGANQLQPTIDVLVTPHRTVALICRRSGKGRRCDIVAPFRSRAEITCRTWF